MAEPTYSIAYPRRRVARSLLRGVGRIIVPALTRATVTGLDRFPKTGPLIVVGNHIATMEVVLMVVYAPWQMEMLGPGDIPPPPAMDAIARFHGYIGINRGNMDRRALTQALDVLRQGGVLGMFPEGGIWDPGAMEAKRGVAWLSRRAGAPILPIGFGGLEGAMDAVFKLERPELVMNVGEVIPPVRPTPGVPRKQALHQASVHIMEAVEALIPPAYRQRHTTPIDERFELRIQAHDPQGTLITIPAELRVAHRDALCKFFYRPALLRIFVKDLGLPAVPLQHLDQRPSPAGLLQGLDPILHYAEITNPGFFTYRFGTTEGLAMLAALRELRALIDWARGRDHTLHIQPARRYRLSVDGDEFHEDTPAASHLW